MLKRLESGDSTEVVAVEKGKVESGEITRRQISSEDTLAIADEEGREDIVETISEPDFWNVRVAHYTIKEYVFNKLKGIAEVSEDDCKGSPVKMMVLKRCRKEGLKIFKYLDNKKDSLIVVDRGGRYAIVLSEKEYQYVPKYFDLTEDERSRIPVTGASEFEKFAYWLRAESNKKSDSKVLPLAAAKPNKPKEMAKPQSSLAGKLVAKVKVRAQKDDLDVTAPGTMVSAEDIILEKINDYEKSKGRGFILYKAVVKGDKTSRYVLTRNSCDVSQLEGAVVNCIVNRVEPYDLYKKHGFKYGHDWEIFEPEEVSLAFLGQAVDSVNHTNLVSNILDQMLLLYQRQLDVERSSRTRQPKSSPLKAREEPIAASSAAVAEDDVEVNLDEATRPDPIIIQTKESDYGSNEMEDFLRHDIDQGVCRVIPTLSKVDDDESHIKKILQDFNRGGKKYCVMPISLNQNHFTGIAIIKDAAGIRVIYFDSTCLYENHPLPKKIGKAIGEVFNVDVSAATDPEKDEDDEVVAVGGSGGVKRKIILTQTVLQTNSGDEGIDNNHCGPFVAFFFSALVNELIDVDESGYIVRRSAGVADPMCIPWFKDDSDRLGILLREYHLSKLAKNEIQALNIRRNILGMIFKSPIVVASLEDEDSVGRVASASGGVAAELTDEQYYSGTTVSDDEDAEEQISRKKEDRKLKREFVDSFVNYIMSNLGETTTATITNFALLEKSLLTAAIPNVNGSPSRVRQLLSSASAETLSDEQVVSFYLDNIDKIQRNLKERLAGVSFVTPSLNSDSVNSAVDNSFEKLRIFKDSARVVVTVGKMTCDCDASHHLMIDTDIGGNCYVGPAMLIDNNWFYNQGTIIYCDGNRYEGGFRAGKYHGVGSFKFADGVACYDGDFVDGRKQGNGFWRTSDGSYYRGQYKGGLRHGLGVMNYKNGIVYDGHFENDKMHGVGELAVPGGGVYKSTFCYGVLHGKTEIKGSKRSAFFHHGNLAEDVEDTILEDEDVGIASTLLSLNPQNPAHKKRVRFNERADGSLSDVGIASSQVEIEDESLALPSSSPEYSFTPAGNNVRF